MCHSAGELVSAVWSEGHGSGQVVLPVVLEGQVSLAGSDHLLSIPDQVDGDFWWVETAHMTDQGVGCPKHSRCSAVHLNLGWSCQETEELSHMYRDDMIKAKDYCTFHPLSSTSTCVPLLLLIYNAVMQQYYQPE